MVGQRIEKLANKTLMVTTTTVSLMMMMMMMVTTTKVSLMMMMVMMMMMMMFTTMVSLMKLARYQVFGISFTLFLYLVAPFLKV